MTNMLRMLGIMLAASVSLTTIASGVVEEKIEGGFGFRLGDVFVPGPTAKQTGAGGDVISYIVPALKPFRAIQTCRVNVTPKTGRIVSIICVSAPFETLDEAQREAMLVAALLKEKYQPKPEPVEQPATTVIQPKPGSPAAAKPATPPPPKPTTTIKVRRNATDTPFPTDITFKQGNRVISTELVATVDSIDQAPGKPTIQVSYMDQDLAQAGVRERQELERERARAWMEEQAGKADTSGL